MKLILTAMLNGIISSMLETSLSYNSFNIEDI